MREPSDGQHGDYASLQGSQSAYDSARLVHPIRGASIDGQAVSLVGFSFWLPVKTGVFTVGSDTSSHRFDSAYPHPVSFGWPPTVRTRRHHYRALTKKCSHPFPQLSTPAESSDTPSGPPTTSERVEFLNPTTDENHSVKLVDEEDYNLGFHHMPRPSRMLPEKCSLGPALLVCDVLLITFLLHVVGSRGVKAEEQFLFAWLVAGAVLGLVAAVAILSHTRWTRLVHWFSDAR